MSPRPPADLSKVKRLSIKSRPRKVKLSDFAKPLGKKASSADFLRSLPDSLKAADFRRLIDLIIEAKGKNKPVILLMGAHVIKVGVSPLIIELVKEGVITHLALNGAGIIHDVELAFWGITSEEVAENIADGSFGMTRETADFLNQLAQESAGEELGLGELVCRKLTNASPTNKSFSLLYGCHQKAVPVTVHVAIGTDTICQHPNFDGAFWGERSYLDFRILIESLKDLGNGGVVLNLGSAVVLPEVFLKALTVARNLYGNITGFAAANFDMIQHYRPNENVVRRPTMTGGEGFSFTGHHEIMIPLLAWGILGGLREHTSPSEKV
ncbi:MAG: hypothetical protein E3J45_06530 [Candidatus Zixiibacteriota bacterium]|nr:MAG: hypothetical protein E3J45_06530 [candidate division Zixibacteria bacterium]